jgi:N-glycosylase/DNA lyase
MIARRKQIMAKVIIEVPKEIINRLDELVDNSDIKDLSVDKRLELVKKINKLLSEIYDEISNQIKNYENNNFKFDKEIDRVTDKAFKIQKEIFSDIKIINAVGMNKHE